MNINTSILSISLGILLPLAAVSVQCLIAITIPQILHMLIDMTFGLSQQLSVQEATAILTCLNHSNVTPHRSPYYTTDVWFGRQNYTVKNYSITTKDGYILKVFRITGSPNHVENGTAKPVVFLNHGLAGTSNQWLVQEGSNNFPGVLADAGYDVWIGNCRGNSYSDKHVNLTLDDIVYWNFTFHEMGIFDLPVVIDKILLETNLTKIYYVGYSLGTIEYMVLLSELPEYNAKIKTGFLLAPAGSVNDSTSPLKLVANLPDLIYNENDIYDPVLRGRVDTNNELQQLLGVNGGEACAASSLANCAVCNNLMFFLLGFDGYEMNYTALPSFYTNYADVIPIKVVAHLGQMTRSETGDFRQFDYGPDRNMKAYNSIVPPQYNLSKISASTIMYYGRGDNLCVPKDVEYLATKFSPGVIKELNLIDRTNTQSKFNHLDFVVGIHDYPFFISKILHTLYLDSIAA